MDRIHPQPPQPSPAAQPEPPRAPLPPQCRALIAKLNAALHPTVNR